MAAKKRQRIIIMGAAGRDFHVFNTMFRGNVAFEVVAFTATQIPNIDGRQYPPVLAGELYPTGIPIHPEEELASLIERHKVDDVVFAYSDISHVNLMHKASQVLATGAGFRFAGLEPTMIPSKLPVISVCAVRTGCGKSQITRAIAGMLRDMGLKAVAIRHPMPYGDLSKQICQRFATIEDMRVHECTIEEMEEYEPHIRDGHLVYAGVDYGAILEAAEKEANVILWDGGNNDVPFFKPDLAIVVADPHRPGHEQLYHPGETNFRMADVIVINKVDTASPEGIAEVEQAARELNPKATVIKAASPVTVSAPDAIRGKNVLVVEDGPTATHGEMAYGAGYVAGQKWGAATIVDPRPYAVGSLKDVFTKYRHIQRVLPAMGYSSIQVRELEETINRVPCDLVLIGTPIDLTRIVKIEKPALRVLYSLGEAAAAELRPMVKAAVRR